MSENIVAFGAFKPCAHHEAVVYRSMMETDGMDVMERVLAIGHESGHATASRSETHYATLDLLDNTGSIIDDRNIPTRKAWEWWVLSAGLQAQHSDCRICEPDAYAATYGGPHV